MAYLGWDAGRQWNPDRGRIGWPWGGVQTPDEANDPISRCEIIRKAQHFERNNWFAGALGEVWVTYTVGSGLPIRSASSDPEWNKRSDQAWVEWCELPDLTSTQDFDSFQCMVAWRVFFDGAGYIYKTRGELPPYRPRVQFIEAAMVQTPSELSSRNDIFDGVERDARGRKVAYYVRQVINGESTFKRIPARDIIPLCDITRPGETHSFSYLANVLDDIQDLKELADYAMNKAKDAADITNVYKTHSGDLPTAEELTKRARELTTETASGTDQTVQRQQHVYKRLGRSRTIAIEVGEEVSQLRSESPNEIEQSHWRIACERVCAGTRIPIILILPESIQGTVARAILDHANTFFKSKSKMFQKAFIEVRRYVTEQLSFFDIKVADKPADWRRFTIRNPRGCNVDVGRNSSAMLAELDAGATTFDDVYGPLGDDKWERLEERFREEQWLDKKSVEYGVPVERIRKSIGDLLKTQMQAEAKNRQDEDDAVPEKKTRKAQTQDA